MQLQATQGKELAIRLKSEIGALASIARLIADKGINIRATSADVCGGEAIVRLVTDDNLRAGDALREQGYNVDEENVVLLDLHSKPGTLHRISESLAREKIDIYHVYGSAPGLGDECLLVLHSANDDHALVTLNEELSR
ncbi:MAG: hypothetical protein ACLFS4_00395 [Opitutales bacterium]